MSPRVFDQSVVAIDYQVCVVIPDTARGDDIACFLDRFRKTSSDASSLQIVESD